MGFHSDSGLGTLDSQLKPTSGRGAAPNLRPALKPTTATFAAVSAAATTTTGAGAGSDPPALSPRPMTDKICTNCKTNRVSLNANETECNTCLAQFTKVGSARDLAEQLKASQKARAEQARSDSKNRSNSATSAHSDSSSRTSSNRTFDWRIRDAHVFVASGWNATYVNACYQKGKNVRDQNYLALAVSSKGAVCPAGSNCPDANKRNSSCRMALHALSYNMAYEMLNADSGPFSADDNPLSMESLLAEGANLNINDVIRRMRGVGRDNRGGERARGGRGRGGRRSGQQRGDGQPGHADDVANATNAATAPSASDTSSPRPNAPSVSTSVASSMPASPHKPTYSDMLAARQHPTPPQSQPASQPQVAAPLAAALPLPTVAVPSTASVSGPPTAPTTAAPAHQPATVPTASQQPDIMALFMTLSAKMDAILQENIELKTALELHKLRIYQVEQLISISSRSTSPRSAPSQTQSPRRAPPPVPPPSAPVSPPEPPHSLPAGDGGGSA